MIKIGQHQNNGREARFQTRSRLLAPEELELLAANNDAIT
jgi:hypothetical protein